MNRDWDDEDDYEKRQQRAEMNDDRRCDACGCSLALDGVCENCGDEEEDE